MIALITIAKKLTLGVVLIAAAAGVLLYSDLGSRNRGTSAATAAESTGPRRVALVQHASQVVIDEGLRGVLEALAQRGYVEGDRLTLRRYNAEGDLPTAAAIASEVTSGDYDLVVTLTTLSLQTIANANKTGGQVPHVFGLVSDPYGAGVGIDRQNHLNHPPYLTGFGSIQPVKEAFTLARQMRPELKSVGVVWNPSESNSLAQMVIARAVCKELGITLVEVSAESSVHVAEAAAAVVSRGVEAIWMSGDVTVLVAADSVIAAAKRAKIPAFTVIPSNAEKGALFDLGANYVEIGRSTGNLAADVLDGRNPADVPVENIVPELLIVNRLALEGLRDRWQIPDAVAAEADVTIDATGKHTREVAEVLTPLPRTMRIDLIEYLDTPNVELTREGLMAGFKQAGLTVDGDLQLRRRNAQGDIATLSTIIDAAITENTDLLLTSSTPALQGALRRGRGKPIVFALVANPLVAGAGKSDTDHLPFVTGAYLPAPHEEALTALKTYMPNVKRLGTLYTPAEVNSVFYKEDLERVAKAKGVELVAVGVNTTGDVPDAALALCGREIDVLFQISDNLTGASFTSIANAAARCRLPLVGFASGQAQKGAMMTVSRDFFDGGVESAKMAARVLRGQNPAGMPFLLVPKIRYTFNLQAARRNGIQLPPDLLARADEIIR